MYENIYELPAWMDTNPFTAKPASWNVRTEKSFCNPTTPSSASSTRMETLFVFGAGTAQRRSVMSIRFCSSTGLTNCKVRQTGISCRSQALDFLILTWRGKTPIERWWRGVQRIELSLYWIAKQNAIREKARQRMKDTVCRVCQCEMQPEYALLSKWWLCPPHMNAVIPASPTHFKTFSIRTMFKDHFDNRRMRSLHNPINRSYMLIPTCKRAKMPQ